MARNIYFISPAQGEPSGGMNKHHEHVQILNQMGEKAYVLFNNQTLLYSWKTVEGGPKAYLKEINPALIACDCNTLKDLPPINKEDIVVVPEIYAQKIIPSLSYANLNAVIFNQNAYLSYISCKLSKEPFSAKKNPVLIYRDPSVLGTIVISKDTVRYLNFVYPGIKIHHLHIGIDTKKFYFEPSKKRKQIAFMPRRCLTDCIQVTEIIKERNQIPSWTLVPIDKVSRDEVAEILKESAVFASFSYEEGLGLPPLEAMACGCIVIGYHGQGGKEFLKSPYAYPIEHGNIVKFVKNLEKAALDYEKNPAKIQKQSQETSRFIKNNYNIEKEEIEVRQIWSKILKEHARRLKN